MAEKKIKDGAAEKAVPNFSKESILGFARYCGRRDLLGVLLEDGQRYTIDEVDAQIDAFWKGGN